MEVDLRSSVPLGKKNKEMAEHKGAANDTTAVMPDQAKIKEVMAKAQKMIEDRKRQLNIMAGKIQPAQAEKFMAEAMLKNTRVDDLRNRISASMKNLSSQGLLTNYQSSLDTAASKKESPSSKLSVGGAAAFSTRSRQLPVTQKIHTLKANIRAEKQAQYDTLRHESTQQLDDKDVESAQFFDQRVKIKPAVREKRKFKFHDPGEFVSQAKKIRAQAKLEKLQQEICQAAKRTGISSAVKLAMVAPKIAEALDTQVPNIEWWDSVLLPEECYVESAEQIRPDVISTLVEHPIQMRPPDETDKAKFLKAFMTKQERKKLRRQNRKEMQKEQQEKYRLGLEPAPEPKVKISNLMRVLGTSAIEDPTKMEAHVRQQMAKRLKKHEDANQSRKLSREQKAAKKAKKLQDDTSSGVFVAVYRVKDLCHPARKFKVEMNAKQLYMTGAVVLHKDMNVVVVEGGQKQQRFFKNLMLKRIKWNEDKKGKMEQPTDEAGAKAVVNKCDLVWEGIVPKRNFGELKFKQCPLEKLGREHFQKHGVEHYWDAAFSGAVLEQTEEDFV